MDAIAARPIYEKAPRAQVPSLRASLLAILLVTSLAPVGVLAYVETSKLSEARVMEDRATFEHAALVASVRADAAVASGTDSLASAALGAPSDSTVFVMTRNGSYRASGGATGVAPDWAASIGSRLSGTMASSDPRIGNLVEIAWSRAPSIDSIIVIERAPVIASAPLDVHFLVVAGFLGAGAIVAAVALTTLVVRPIRRLDQATRGLADEATHVPLKPKGSREVRALAASFNRMSSALDTKRAEMEAYIENLDKLVTDRTRSLTESRTDVEALVFTIAHELREPMRSMRTTAELVLADKVPGEALEALDLLRSRITYLERVLFALMRFDEIARREEPLAEVDTHDLAERAASLARAEMSEKPISIDVGPLPHLHAYPSLLIEAFTEIFRNTIQHSHTSRVVVRGTIEGNHAVIHVDDEGPGIPVNRREDAFHLFQKLSPDSPGTGAGLAIVRRVAERHDGQAHLESAPSGTRLVLKLPIDGPAPRAPAPEPQTARTF